MAETDDLGLLLWALLLIAAVTVPGALWPPLEPYRPRHKRKRERMPWGAR